MSFLFPDDAPRQPATTVGKAVPQRAAQPKGKKTEEVELSEEETAERFYGNTSMIGVVAPVPGPRFCWMLDQHFRTAFVNNPDDTLEMMVGKDGKVLRRKKNKKGKSKPAAAPLPSLFGPAVLPEPAEVGGDEVGERYFFPVYCHRIPNSIANRYLVYKLRSGAVSLLPKGGESRYDYMWLVQTGDPEHDAHLILDILRSMPGIQVAQKLSAEEMERCKEYLVF